LLLSSEIANLPIILFAIYIIIWNAIIYLVRIDAISCSAHIASKRITTWSKITVTVYSIIWIAVWTNRLCTDWIWTDFNEVQSEIPSRNKFVTNNAIQSWAWIACIVYIAPGIFVCVIAEKSIILETCLVIICQAVGCLSKDNTVRCRAQVSCCWNTAWTIVLLATYCIFRIAVTSQ